MFVELQLGHEKVQKVPHTHNLVVIYFYYKIILSDGTQTKACPTSKKDEDVKYSSTVNDQLRVSKLIVPIINIIQFLNCYPEYYPILNNW